MVLSEVECDKVEDRKESEIAEKGFVRDSFTKEKRREESGSKGFLAGG